MFVIRLPEEEEVTEEAKRTDEKGRELTLASRMTSYGKALSYRPQFQKNVVESWHHILIDKKLTRKIKEMVALGVSISNACQYSTVAHSTLLKKLFKLNDAEISELASVASHVSGVNALEKANGLRLSPSVIDEERQKILNEIKETFGFLPRYYNIAACDLEYLKLLWEREKVVLFKGTLEAKAKVLTALGVSVSKGCLEAGKAYSELSKKLGTSEEEIMEVIQTTENFNFNNTFTAGLQLPLGVWGREDKK